MDMHSVPQKQNIMPLNTIFGRFQTFLLEVRGLNLVQIANYLNKGDGFLWRFGAIISVCLNVILAFVWRE